MPSALWYSWFGIQPVENLTPASHKAGGRPLENPAKSTKTMEQLGRLNESSTDDTSKKTQ